VSRLGSLQVIIDRSARDFIRLMLVIRDLKRQVGYRNHQIAQRWRFSPLFADFHSFSPFELAVTCASAN
jgi:hypothetical protein